MTGITLKTTITYLSPLIYDGDVRCVFVLFKCLVRPDLLQHMLELYLCTTCFNLRVRCFDVLSHYLVTNYEQQLGHVV